MAETIPSLTRLIDGIRCGKWGTELFIGWINCLVLQCLFNRVCRGGIFFSVITNTLCVSRWFLLMKTLCRSVILPTIQRGALGAHLTADKADLKALMNQ